MEEASGTRAHRYEIAGSPYNVCMCFTQLLPLNDDVDDSYFLDHHDGDDGDADSGPALGHLDGGALAAQAKRDQLMNILC